MKGGTWMGANEAGLFVGLTNQRTFKTADKNRRSRGEVVLEALSHRSLLGLEAWLATLSPRDYNPFNLMFGTAERMRVAYFHEDMAQPELADVPPGTHVLPNDRLDANTFSKVKRAQALIEPWSKAPWDKLRAHLHDALADRFLPPIESVPPTPQGAMMPRRLVHRLEALCIKTPLYGTRSSTLAALDRGRVAHYLATPGPPDEWEFDDYTGLLSPA